MSDQTRPVANGTANPAGELLRGGGLPAVFASLVLAMGSLMFDGWSTAVSCLVGSTLAIAALTTGPLLLRLGRGYSPIGLMSLAICGYCLVVLTLGVAFILVSEASWLAGTAAAIGSLVGAGVWLIGQARSTSRLRVLAYGDVGDLPSGSEATSNQLPLEGKEGRGVSR